MDSGSSNFQAEGSREFARHKPCVDTGVQIVTRDVAAKRSNQQTQQVRESSPPRFAKTERPVTDAISPILARQSSRK